MKFKRILAMLISICIIFSGIAFANEDYATRGEVAEYLLNAADFYNPGVKKSDIIKGYEDGSLHEDWSITRAEALVMLKRAFGELPEPVGHNSRTALTAEDFTDIPSWAKGELQNVFDSGIVAGTGNGKFSPNQNVTMKQMELFVDRVFSLLGENYCDDFYATANKDALENMRIPYGEYIQGTIYEMQTQASTQLDEIIMQIVNGSHKYGTSKQKIQSLYQCITDTKSIEETSVAPVQEYFDAIDDVKNIGELSMLDARMAEELCVNSFVGFSLTVDFEDSSKYILCFNSMRPLMNKEFYFEGSEEEHRLYLNYLETMLEISGEDEKTAKANAKAYFEFEKLLAENMLSAEEQSNVEEIYNVYKYNKIEAMFPDFNLDEMLEADSLSKNDRVIVLDTNLTYKFSELYNQSNLDVLKTTAKISVLAIWGECLDLKIGEAYQKLENKIFGTEGEYTVEQKAILVLQNTVPEYLGEIYVKKHFDEKSKKDVLKMANDIKNVFKERINSLSWMSDETKVKAIRKLDSMQINIGYPDSFSSFIDDVDIKSPEKGGTYFGNMLAVAKAYKNYCAALQNVEVDNSSWSIYPYTANAGYDLTANSITFPAAILQAPLYDKNASYEENLGGIGYIMAHEMTHAFDSNGALFDENGNMSDWWNQTDYNEFESLCGKVVDFYDGYEFIPGVKTNGVLTLSENVADMGAAACITELAGKKKNVDYKSLFVSMANTFATTYTREYAEYLSKYDPHADSKARVNSVLCHIDEFYDAFGIKSGDGMYIPPEERIVIW